jgi:peptide/nickel transport system substrate-binding protein
VLPSSLDPANTLDLWLSSGSFHFWNPSQRSPATPWERQIDELMTRQVAAPTLAERQMLFAEVQRIFGEQLPAIYFVAPRVTLAMSTRVRGATPAVLEPKILWNPDVLYLSGPRS